MCCLSQSKGTIGRSDDYILFHGDAIVGNLDHPFNIRFSVMNGLSETKTDMRIYPNPIDRNMPFTIALSDGEMVSEVQVYNTMGEAMAHWMGIVEHPVMSGLPASGVYMLKVVCKSGNVYLGKLVVK